MPPVEALAIREVDRPGRLSDQVVAALRAHIESGELAPGARLPTEQLLGERFAVSRAVVREAIARLKADGYVETRQGAGAFVAARPGLASFRIGHEGRIEARELAQIFELRAAVEVAAARLAAERRTRGDLAAIRAALEQMARALVDGAGGADGAVADDAFHRAIATATHNAYLHRFIEFLGHHFSESRRLSWTDAGRRADQPHAAQREHERMYAAIARGDAAAAARAAEDHLRGSAARLGVGSAGRRAPRGGQMHG
ncbi:MAG: FadR family transcriptional regulator [Burkholderiales bacterium]|nr:FadR family transcriptional regulator [Burkholderiales bacterium]